MNIKSNGKSRFIEPRNVRGDGREVDITVNGNSAEVLEKLKALGPEALTTEALTLEEIFVATLK
jgi:hypothetical protein